jgi:hypothetical protein
MAARVSMTSNGGDAFPRPPSGMPCLPRTADLYAELPNSLGAVAEKMNWTREDPPNLDRLYTGVQTLRQGGDTLATLDRRSDSIDAAPT